MTKCLSKKQSLELLRQLRMPTNEIFTKEEVARKLTACLPQMINQKRNWLRKRALERSKILLKHCIIEKLNFQKK
jgi:hypothetical protein